MKTVALSALFIILVVTSVCAQRIQPLNKTGGTLIYLDTTVHDVGPVGDFESSLPANDVLDSTTLVGYPKLINLPDSLKGMRIFTYIRNPRQFYYQNYRKGIYSKNFFLDYFQKRRWQLTDTTALSSKTVQCYCTFVVGYDRLHKPKCVIDTNGNNDFSDDEIFTLRQSTFSRNAQTGNSDPKNISIEYFDGKNITHENISCLIYQTSGANDMLNVTIKFPQFRYAKVLCDDKNFFVCQDMNAYNVIYIMSGKPNFEQLSADKTVRANQIATFGDQYFKFEPISQNYSILKFTAGFTESDKKLLNVNSTASTIPSK